MAVSRFDRYVGEFTLEIPASRRQQSGICSQMNPRRMARVAFQSCSAASARRCQRGNNSSIVVRGAFRKCISFDRLPSPEGHLQGLDLSWLNTTVLEDFIKLACVEATEWALLLRIFWQKLLSNNNNIHRSGVP